MRIFVAGATGALGRRLTPLLVSGGHHVVGTTRTRAKRDLSLQPRYPTWRQGFRDGLGLG